MAIHKRFWLPLAAALTIAACGDDGAGGMTTPVDTGPDAPEDASTETGDAADSGADVGADSGDDADVGPDVPPPPMRATVENDTMTATISFDPTFALTVVRKSDGMVVSTRPGSGAFGGVAIGWFEPWSPGIFYEPTLTMLGDRQNNLTWYNVDSPVSYDGQDGTSATFVATTVDASGSPGPEVTLTLTAEDPTVSLRVVADSANNIVYSNLTLLAEDDEGYFGLGEHFDKVDLRDSIREMQIQAVGTESGTNEVHVPVPFVMSTRGYAVFTDDRAPGAFDLAATESDGLRITYDSQDVTHHFFVAEPNEPMDLLEQYTDVVGKPAFVPMWALTPHFWRNVNIDDQELLSDAQLARDNDIPAGVVWVDRPWSSYYHNWLFNPSMFPDPEQMFTDLEAIGFRVMLHHSPQLNPPGDSDLEPEDASEGLYRLYVDNSWLVYLDQERTAPFTFPWGGGTGAFIDWSNPGAVEHVQGLIRRVTDLGAVGTKMDWDEFLQPNVASVRLNLYFFNGETNFTMKTWYSALYHKAIIEGFDEGLGEPSFHVSRSGTSRDQVWNTCIWPGDLDNDFSEHRRPEHPDNLNVGGLPAAIVANQTLGMSGFPCFASDIGGFRDGQPGEEVLMRWMAFGTFNAVMQIGGGGGSHMPWTADSEYSAQALDITRTYTRLRMDLVPYVYHWLRQAHLTGRPLVRSLWLAYPDDRMSRDHERDFLFGPDIYVAPTYVEGASERSFYLPTGEWLDWWTGEVLEGGAMVTEDTPIERIVVKLRQGAIVPMFPSDLDTVMPATDDDVVTLEDRRRMRLFVFPRGERSVVFYNGLGVDLTETAGDVDIEVTVGTPEPEQDTRFVFAPEGIDLVVALAGTNATGGPTSVELTRDGGTTTMSEGSACDDCYEVDAELDRVVVRLAAGGLVQIR